MQGWLSALIGGCLLLSSVPGSFASSILGGAADAPPEALAPAGSNEIGAPSGPLGPARAASLARPLAGGAPSLPAARPVLQEPAPLSSVEQQDISEQATLETRQPEVQWAAGAADWQAVPARQTVRAGDRVRTNAAGTARIVYFEGTITEISPSTGIVVQRLERSPSGNVVANLFQAVGTTVNRVVRLTDAAATFEIETPAATAFVRGTTPRVQVAPSGATRVQNVPDGTDGVVTVTAKDPTGGQVTLQPGQQTSVLPGLPPSPPGPITQLPFFGDVVQTSQQQVQTQAVERQEQRQIEQARAQEAAAQAQSALVAFELEMMRLMEQERRLAQEVVRLLTPGTGGGGGGGAGGNDRQQIASALTPDGSGACATQTGQQCQISGDLSGSQGTVTASMSWRILVPANRIPSGAIATVFIPTTVGIEFFDCPPPTTGQATVCTGTTSGNGRQGGTVRVFANNTQIAQGSILGQAGVSPTTTHIATGVVVTNTPTPLPMPSPCQPPGTICRVVVPPGGPGSTVTGTIVIGGPCTIPELTTGGGCIQFQSIGGTQDNLSGQVNGVSLTGGQALLSFPARDQFGNPVTITNLSCALVVGPGQVSCSAILSVFPQLGPITITRT